MKRRISKRHLMKTFRVTLILMLSMMIIFSGCSDNAPSSGETNEDVKTLELKLAHFFPNSHPAEKHLIQPWAEAIEEATEGRVVITSYPNQTLLQADSIYDGVVNGVADMGLSCFSYTRGRFPVLEVFELPGITYLNSKVASRVAWEGIMELNPEEVQDTKLMMVIATGPGDLYTKVPVYTLDDIQGLELRATGLSAKTLEALGAIPVAMAQSEAYESLSKGVVQGNLGPIEVLKGWRQAEVTENLTLTPFLYNTLFFVNMNLETWNSISPEDQETILSVNQEFFEQVGAGLWDMQNEDALIWAEEDQGIEVITLSQEEQNKWKSFLKPIQDEYVNKINENGLQGQEILDLVSQLADKYNEEYK
jgi:TRAP-type C4-dicarboxylate transport system substrate-binding protein